MYERKRAAGAQAVERRLQSKAAFHDHKNAQDRRQDAHYHVGAEEQQQRTDQKENAARKLEPEKVHCFSAGKILHDAVQAGDEPDHPDDAQQHRERKRRPRHQNETYKNVNNGNDQGDDEGVFE